MLDQFIKLKELISKYNPNANFALIEKAYNLSNQAHAGQEGFRRPLHHSSCRGWVILLSLKWTTALLLLESCMTQLRIQHSLISR